MINISVSIGEVTTDIMTDQQMSFDGIETLLNRATTSTIEAYNRYFVSTEEFEKLTEDESE
jgi:hypothetical protein